MERSYKFRIYPNKKQENQIQHTFGCCRFVFNYYLAKHREAYEQDNRTLTYCDCAGDMTLLKAKLEWLKEADSTALQSSLKDLDNAYQNFFKQKGNYPKFKSKHNRRKSYKTRSNIKVLDGAVRLPKLGRVKCRVSGQVTGRILSATVSRNPSGKYFVSLCCTDADISPLPCTGKFVGLDMGLKSFAVLSDGTEYLNHKYLAKSMKKLARLQRKLSRKPKESNRREKARIQMARLHEHIANQRLDMLHKLSTELVRQYDTICIEDLSVSNMLGNHKLARSVMDVSWHEFRRQLEYKSGWYGKQVIVIDRFFPSSQLCSVCGEQWQGTRNLSVREWTCPSCGVTHGRDVNAAKNILREGLRLQSVW